MSGPLHCAMPLKTAQLKAWSKKNCVSAQPCARQFATQEMLTDGGLLPSFTQPMAHVNAWKQLFVVHAPQSFGQFEHVSYCSHLLLPQNEQTPQSCWHEAHVSGGLQMPSPQPWHWPQSPGQVKQFSFLFASHLPSPQPAQTPQSGAQDRQVSPLLQKPSPQVAHLPQSCGHDEHVSVDWQVPSPHVLQSPQSTEQFVQLSVDSHVPLPHVLGTAPSGRMLPSRLT